MPVAPRKKGLLGRAGFATHEVSSSELENHPETKTDSAINMQSIRVQHGVDVDFHQRESL